MGPQFLDLAISESSLSVYKSDASLLIFASSGVIGGTFVHDRMACHNVIRRILFLDGIICVKTGLNLK